MLMKTGKLFNGWSLAFLLLVLVIISSSTYVLLKIPKSPDIEITLSPERSVEGKIFVNGSVNNPGFYPFYADDSLEDIIKAAGGLKEGVDLNSVELSVAPADDGAAQKINVNRAEVWLLEALPGIGEVKAAALIIYREQNGPFRDINELLRVPGFSESILDRIKNLITIQD